MEIERRSANGCEIFYLKGNVEIYSTEDLREDILEPISQENYPRVIINLQDVDFVDSSGLGLLMNLQFKLKEKTEFRFCCMKNNIKMAIEYTNLIGFFKIDESEEESIHGFLQ